MKKTRQINNNETENSWFNRVPSDVGGGGLPDASIRHLKIVFYLENKTFFSLDKYCRVTLCSYLLCIIFKQKLPEDSGLNTVDKQMC